MNFSEKIKKLDEIVDKMENKDLDLDESLKLYKKGSNLCDELLKEIEIVIKNIEEDVNE